VPQASATPSWHVGFLVVKKSIKMLAWAMSPSIQSQFSFQDSSFKCQFRRSLQFDEDVTVFGAEEKISQIFFHPPNLKPTVTKNVDFLAMLD
jgi:hypothetical protein